MAVYVHKYSVMRTNDTETANKMMGDGDPNPTSLRPLVADVLLGRCVRRQSVDGRPMRFAFTEHRTIRLAVFSAIALVQSKLH